MAGKMMDNGLANDNPATPRFKTLVVDDEHDLANLAAELLNYHGIDALIAYSAQEALGIMETRTDIDAIFSDVMMPSMTGLEFAGIVEKTYPAVKIVLTSGFIALNSWEQTVHHYDFVAKPYSIDKVVQLLRP